MLRCTIDEFAPHNRYKKDDKMEKFQNINSNTGRNILLLIIDLILSFLNGRNNDGRR